MTQQGSLTKEDKVAGNVQRAITVALFVALVMAIVALAGAYYSSRQPTSQGSVTDKKTTLIQKLHQKYKDTSQD